MFATKQSLIAMEHAHGLNCTVFFIDFRAYSKGFDAYYERAKKSGVRYIRALPSAIRENSDTKNLSIHYVPPGNGHEAAEEFDMVVLSCGLQPPAGVNELARQLGIELTPDSFCRTQPLSPLETTRPGIYVCGPFVEPKDIPETVTQASGAAAKAMALLADVRGTMVTPKVYPPEIEITGQEPRVGVFVCHCGTNIGSVVDVPQVVEYAKTLPNVVHAERNLFTCSTDTQENIKRKIKEFGLNRVVVASCTPRTHEPLFQNTIREAGLNAYLFEMANIRDQCSWVHMHEHEAATQKAKDLVRIAVAKVRLLEALYRRDLELNHDALVIGGGLAGMTAALELARQGIHVNLVERETELGGNVRRLHYLLEGQNPRQL
ncbi:MAG: FAD-dependent oxidoreductase, partial [Chloroflexota bacterium]|nr:FAD-dependent oxidoreductase [Chloroflexota bacterium]